MRPRERQPKVRDGVASRQKEAGVMDERQEEPTEPSQVTFIQRIPRRWLVALVEQGGLSQASLDEYDRRYPSAAPDLPAEGSKSHED
jgi:hypothetical protein